MASDAKLQSSNKFLAVFKYLLIAFVGYLAAVVIATFVTIALLALTGLFSQQGSAFFAENDSGVGGVFILGLVFTFVFASPGFIITLILAKIKLASLATVCVGRYIYRNICYWVAWHGLPFFCGMPESYLASWLEALSAGQPIFRRLNAFSMAGKHRVQVCKFGSRQALTLEM